jgi:hypothetical protein
VVCSIEGWVQHSWIKEERWGIEDGIENNVGESGGEFGSSIGVVRQSHGAGGVDGKKAGEYEQRNLGVTSRGQKVDGNGEADGESGGGKGGQGGKKEDIWRVDKQMEMENLEEEESEEEEDNEEEKSEGEKDEDKKGNRDKEMDGDEKIEKDGDGEK